MSAAQQQTSLSPNHSNDYFRVPATDKQIDFAKQISQRTGVALPREAQQDRYALSRWIAFSSVITKGLKADTAVCQCSAPPEWSNLIVSA